MHVERVTVRVGGDRTMRWGQTGMEVSAWVQRRRYSRTHWSGQKTWVQRGR